SQKFSDHLIQGHLYRSGTTSRLAANQNVPNRQIEKERNPVLVWKWGMSKPARRVWHVQMRRGPRAQRSRRLEAENSRRSYDPCCGRAVRSRYRALLNKAGRQMARFNIAGRSSQLRSSREQVLFIRRMQREGLSQAASKCTS